MAGSRTPRYYHNTAGMDALRAEVERLGTTATLNHSIEDVDKVLEQLLQARESIAAGEPHSMLWVERTWADTHQTQPQRRLHSLGCKTL